MDVPGERVERLSGQPLAEDIPRIGRSKIEGTDALRHRHAGEPLVARKKTNDVSRARLGLMMPGRFEYQPVRVRPNRGADVQVIEGAIGIPFERGTKWVPQKIGSFDFGVGVEFGPQQCTLPSLALEVFQQLVRAPLRFAAFGSSNAEKAISLV